MTDMDQAQDAATASSAPGTSSVTDTRLLAAQLFNEAWRLMNSRAGAGTTTTA